MQSYKERTRGLTTHSKIEDFMYCEQLYKQKWEDESLDLEDEEDEDEEDSSVALLIGSAFDCYIQDVRKFNEDYAIVARRTGSTGKIELTQKQGELIMKMAKEFLRQPLFNPVGILQYNVKMQWGSLTLSSTPDEFQPENKIIADNKTCASLRKLEGWMPKYKRQLAFAQMIEEAKTKILHAGMIRAVSKEKVPKFQSYYFHAEDLLEERSTLTEAIERLVIAKTTGEFTPETRDKCLECKAYAKCPFSVQQKLVIM